MPTPDDLVPADEVEGLLNSQITETKLRRWVIREAYDRGWYVSFHDTKAPTHYINKKGQVRRRREMIGKGYPDLFLLHVEQRRTVWAELKAEDKDLSPDQEIWRDKFLAAGKEWYLWRPSDMDAIKEILR